METLEVGHFRSLGEMFEDYKTLEYLEEGLARSRQKMGRLPEGQGRQALEKSIRKLEADVTGIRRHR